MRIVRPAALLTVPHRIRPMLLLASLLFGCAAGEPPRTNVVLLIGDDHGYPYFGFTGSTEVSTPTLDRLASEGTVFEHGFSTASVCRPALFSLLTARQPFDRKLYEERTGTDAALFGAPVSAFGTLPAILGEAGYATFQGGKHWEGHYRKAGFTEGTTDPKSYDRERAHELSQIASIAGAGGLMLARDTMQPVYDFIDRNQDAPFFVWFAPMLPHAPMDPPAEFRDPYTGHELSRSAESYYANCTRFDAAVEDLLDHLERRGVLDNTLVIYVSDNGFDQPPHREYPVFGGPGGKMSVHELGFRTPIILHHPAQVGSGVTREDIVSIVDIPPTILDYLGLPIPPEWPGRSLRPAVDGKETEARTVLVGWQERQRPNSARNRIATRPFFWATTPRWHYAFTPETGSEQLFDREADPMGTLDVAKEHPSVVARLRREVETWSEERKDAAQRFVRSRAGTD